MKRPVVISQVIVFTAWLIPGCGSRVSPPSSPQAKPASGFYHVVRPGENLFRIGKAYDVGFEELARINGIRNPGHIRIGQKIFIPGAVQQLPVEIITPAEASTPTRSPPVPETTELTLLWPVAGTINSAYGPRGSNFHDGIDIAAPEGTSIRAIEQGEVIYSDQLRGYGNIVIIRHDGSIVSVYAHNQINLVREGQRVARGDEIARVGSTGRVTGPHLHFEIRKNNTSQNPLHYLPQLCCLPASGMVAPKG